MLFENIMVGANQRVSSIKERLDFEFSLSNPWECTQNRDNDENVRNDAADNDSIVLHSAIPDNVDDLEHQPTKTLSAALHGTLEDILTQLRREHIPSGCPRHAAKLRLLRI
jgi:hypothetical protein